MTLMYAFYPLCRCNEHTILDQYIDEIVYSHIILKIIIDTHTVATVTHRLSFDIRLARWKTYLL